MQILTLVRWGQKRLRHSSSRPDPYGKLAPKEADTASSPLLTSTDGVSLFCHRWGDKHAGVPSAAVVRVSASWEPAVIT